MRVALFSDTFLPKVDGIVKVVCLLLDHLAERGVESAIFVPRMDERQRYANTRVISVPGVTFPLYPDLKMSPPRLSTYRELKAFDPDVVHFIHPIILGLGSFLLAKQLRIPTLISFHIDFGRIAHYFNVGPLNLGFMEYLADFLTPLFFNWADYSLAPSRQIQRDLVALGCRNVGLWGRGVDAERFHPCYRNDAMRARLSDGHPDETLLLYVGRLSIEKSLEHLRPVLENVPNTRLAIVGDGPLRDDLQARFAGTNTTFMGYLHGEELSQAYASADMFVFPSAIESFGLVVVEALAAGLPVVASRVGGVCDVVDEGRTGYTFDVGDIPTMIDGVRRVADDRAYMAEMGLAARAFAETQTWPSMMDEVVMHYERLAQLKRRR